MTRRKTIQIKDRKLSKKKVDETPQVRQLKPRTANQAKYIRAICESDIVLCTGYPGTGKTACAARLACEWLIEGKIKKILLTRPLIDAGEKGFGFLPGELIEKISPYLTPVLDEISEYFSDVEIRKM